MYEKILEWGVDALTKGVLARAGHEQNILLEAIKTKNALIVKRFDYAWTNCTQLLEVFVEQDARYREHVATWKSRQDGTALSTKLLESIKRELHPPFFSKVSHYRARFEATNELISSYTLAIFNAIRFDNIESMVGEFAGRKKKEVADIGDVKYVYTNVLSHSLSALSAVLRRTTSASGPPKFSIAT